MLASYRKGVELGAPMLELDAHLSVDSELMMIHNDRIYRTTNGTERVGQVTVAELKRLDAGRTLDVAESAWAAQASGALHPRFRPPWFTQRSWACGVERVEHPAAEILRIGIHPLSVSE